MQGTLYEPHTLATDVTLAGRARRAGADALPLFHRGPCRGGERREPGGPGQTSPELKLYRHTAHGLGALCQVSSTRMRTA